jgi:hypothetical protein
MCRAKKKNHDNDACSRRYLWCGVLAPVAELLGGLEPLLLLGLLIAEMSRRRQVLVTVGAARVRIGRYASPRRRTYR